MNGVAPGADVVVVGAGAAGMAAAIDCVRGGLSVRIVEQLGFGGELINVSHALSADEPRSGLDVAGELTGEMMGASVMPVLAETTALVHHPESGGWEVVTDGGAIAAAQVVLATGGRPRKLDARGASELEGRGVSYCAACDGPQFAGQAVALVADSRDRWAAAEAEALAEFAGSLYVIASDPGPELERAAERASASLVRGTLAEVVGEQRVEAVVAETEAGARRIEVAAAFGAIGRLPNAELAGGWADTAPDGRVVTDADLRCRTAGLAAAGDVRAGAEPTATAAIADGRAAARAVLARAG